MQEDYCLEIDAELHSDSVLQAIDGELVSQRDTTHSCPVLLHLVKSHAALIDLTGHRHIHGSWKTGHFCWYRRKVGKLRW